MSIQLNINDYNLNRISIFTAKLRVSVSYQIVSRGFVSILINHYECAARKKVYSETWTHHIITHFEYSIIIVIIIFIFVPLKTSVRLKTEKKWFITITVCKMSIYTDIKHDTYVIYVFYAIITRLKCSN